MLVLLVVFGLLAAALFVFLRQPQFGAFPEGARLERVERSPHHADGSFHNLVPTPQLTEGVGYAAMLKEYLFDAKPRLQPSRPLPAVKTDLRALDKGGDVLVWFGHSSFFMRLDGKTFLVDPVFNDHASPFPFSTRAFAGTTLYAPEDMPKIDYLIVSHDHWDHLDYRTVTALKPDIGKVVCALGVGAHLERWGFAPETILEADWFETLELEPGLAIHALPARHFSGRDLRRDRTLWVAFVVETSERRIFYSGDSGYGPHFAEIGQRFAGFDLAILENGQYDEKWKYIHMMPEEAVRAAEELKAKSLLPVHAGKFAIANHPWDEPFRRIAEASKGKAVRLLTPKIGEPVRIADDTQAFSSWWEGVEGVEGVNAVDMAESGPR